ncbi:MAG TPA: hypothetical protein VE261_01730, partial [Gaiellaceae bacterium]|nr:hypothetical protein [Gaiellaceae bacterium]
PFLYKTTDLGRTWTKITAGIPDDDFCRIVREDPVRPNVLYAGTETGLYVSHDGGRRWQRVQANLPHVPVHDLAVREGELVLATHGRSFWALDDITPLREGAPASGEHLYAPRPAYRVRSKGGFGGRAIPGRNYRSTDATILMYEFSEDPATGDRTERYLDAGKNPPDGAIVHYWLPAAPEGEVKLSFHDARGRLIREFTSRRDRPEAAPTPEAALPGEGAETQAAPGGSATGTEKKKEPRVKTEAGLNRFVWNLRYPDAARIEGDPSMDEFERALAGPLVPPGGYEVRLKAGGETLRQELEVRMDPRVPAGQPEILEQFDLLLRIRDKVSQTHEAIMGIRTLRKQIGDLEARSADDRAFRQITRAAADLRKQLLAIEGELVQWRAKSRQDTLNWPAKLNAKLGGLAAYVGQSDTRPTAAQLELFADLSQRVDAQLAALDAVVQGDLKRFTSLVRSAKLPAVTLPKVEARRPERRAAAAAR